MALNAGRIAALIGAHAVDLVHSRSRAPAWSALIAARRTQTPFVTTYHGAYGGIGRLKTAYNSVMARGDVVIANSQFTAQLIRARHHTPPERLRVIHRGVDLARFDPADICDARLQALRSAWGVAPETRVILMAARLTGWKGQRVLIEATALLRDQGRLPGIAVILAGDAQGRDGYAQALGDQIAGAGHWFIGSIDWALLGSLLVGSIPGIMIGSHVASRVPDRVLRPILAGTLAVVGARLAL